MARGETLISDGATGTYLQGHGLEPGGCPEAFNVSDADVVRGMAREYFEAGADMVLTNSFGGSRFMLGKYGLADRVSGVQQAGGGACAQRGTDRVLCSRVGGADGGVPGAAG